MNTQQLQEILKRGIGHRLGGVYALNELPTHSEPDKFYICNTQPDWLPGEHWLAIYIGKQRQAEYFDSYGRPPKEAILKLLSTNSDRCVYNSKRL